MAPHGDDITSGGAVGSHGGALPGMALSTDDLFGREQAAWRQVQRSARAHGGFPSQVTRDRWWAAYRELEARILGA